MLQVTGLSSGYGDVPVIEDITLEVFKNEVVSIIGPNGAGKTSLLHTIIGLLHPLSGRITFEGQEITGLPPHLIIERGVTLVPERRRIFPSMSVLENLQMGGYLVRDREVMKERLQRVFDLFPVLNERRNQMAGMLSGGEQQMLAVGRGLMLDPKLMLFDEPSLGLAPKIVDQLYETIARLNRDGVTILIVEQNITKVLSVASRAYVMQRGRVMMEDSSERLSSNPDLVSTYLTSY